MMHENDQRLRKYLQGLAVVRGLQRQVAASAWELEKQLDDLNRRLDVIERGDNEPLFCESFGKPSNLEAMTSPRWLN